MERLICLVIGYLCGIIQTGFIYGKMNNVDIRKLGSGNAGTTNALRTLGWKAGVVKFLGDFLKTILAAVIVRLIFGGDHEILRLLIMYTGFGVVLGHNYPFYLNFKGGKGIAATAGLTFIIDPVVCATVVAIFLAIFLTTKYVSLGSLTILIVFVVEVIIFGEMGKYGLSGSHLYEMYAIAVILAVLGWWRHRENIKRLLSGTENKIHFSKIKK